MHYDLFEGGANMVPTTLIKNFLLIRIFKPDHVEFSYPTPEKPINVSMKKISKEELAITAKKNIELFKAMGDIGGESKCFYESVPSDTDRELGIKFLQELNCTFFNNTVINLPGYDIIHAAVHEIKPIPLGCVIVSISDTHCLAISSRELFIEKS